MASAGIQTHWLFLILLCCKSYIWALYMGFNNSNHMIFKKSSYFFLYLERPLGKLVKNQTAQHPGTSFLLSRMLVAPSCSVLLSAGGSGKFCCHQGQHGWSLTGSSMGIFSHKAKNINREEFNKMVSILKSFLYESKPKLLYILHSSWMW